jgi:iron(III) transport system substrate-binding protein
MDDSAETNDARVRVGRRKVLLSATAGTAALLAGCSGGGGNDTTTAKTTGSADDGDGGSDLKQIGSGMTARETPGGTPIAELPDLSGTINVYSGRGEPLVGGIVSTLEETYPDLDLKMRYDSASRLLARMQNEGQNSPADVFFTVNAGALGSLANRDRTQDLSDDVLSMAREEFRAPSGQWVGTSGRVRTVPYNTNELDSVPEDIFAYAEESRFENALGWAPTYSSFQGFITAMRILNGEDRTREWLNGMQNQGVQAFPDEFVVAQAVADGEIKAGFTNHYYIQRVINSRNDPPITTGNTVNDAGSIFNVAGAAVVDTASDAEMAQNLIRHLLSAEAQEYFAVSRTFEYPAIPEVEPLEELPSLDELNPPDVDLTQLSDLQPTIDLLQKVGVL